MQKTTFKIATNFTNATRTEPVKPTDFIEVEGLVIGDWGITDWGIDGVKNSGDDFWTIYHVGKGLRLSFLYFTYQKAIEMLNLTIELFGEHHDGINTPETCKLMKQWESVATGLCHRGCLYDDDDCDDTDDTDDD